MDTALTILAGASFSVSLFAVVKLLLQQQATNTNTNKPTDEAVLKATAKADELVHRASQSARKIIVKAELEGIREIARDKIEASKLEAAFERELATLMATVLNKIEAIGTETNTKQQAYLARSQRLLDMRFTTFFDQAASSLLTTSTNAQAKLEEHVDKEIATAQAEIKAYKNARLKLLDEQFISLVEDAMRVVLEKKLTASDQMDLIYHSLAEAKKDGVIA